MFCTIVGFLALSTEVFAHQTGSSWENTVNGYKIDVGYDPVVIKAGESQRFDFDIFKPGSTDEEKFTDVWIRIADGQNTIFASGIHKLNFGKPGMIFTFPKGGNYQMSIRFENNDQTLVEEIIPISVNVVNNEVISLRKSKFNISQYIFGAVLFVVGLGMGRAARILSRKKNENN